MRMKVGLWRLLIAGTALAVPLLAWSAPPVGEASRTLSATDVPADLRQQIENVVSVREATLRQMDARYQAAPLDQRVAMEAEMAQVQTDFELEYLSLLLEFHRLSGNVQEEVRTAAMLEALAAQPPVTRVAQSATENTPQPGGTNDAR